MPRKASQDSDDKKAASKNKKKTGSKSKQQKTSGEKLWDKKFDKMFGPQKKEQGLEINISLGEDPKKEFPIKAPL